MAYLSENEDEWSQAMSQALKEAFQDKLDNYQQMKSVVQTFVNKRECSIQESVYQVLSGQWLRKTFPGVIFANSNIPEKDTAIVAKKKICLSCQRIQGTFSKRTLLIGILIDQIYHFVFIILWW